MHTSSAAIGSRDSIWHKQKRYIRLDPCGTPIVRKNGLT